MKRAIAVLALCFMLLSTMGTAVMAHNCVDKDRDYWCDDCGMLISHTCVDYNKDTWCDKCSCWIPHTCYDKDADHLCDQCGKVLDVSINITVTSSLPEHTATLYFYEGTYPSVFKVLEGTEASHTFRCAANSHFQLTVMKYGHPTRNFYYNTYLSNINIHAELYPYGDASQDGKVNVGDVAKVYAHVRAYDQITDEYQYQCADVNSDEALTVGDVAKIYSHIRGTKPLF